MAEVKWIKLATNLFDNRKIKQIRKLPDGDAIIVIWMQIICLAGITNDSGMVYFSKDIPYTDEMLAIEFDRSLNLIRLALTTFERFGMIEIIDNILLVSNWEKYQNTDGLEKIREQNRIRKQRQRENEKLIECHVTSHANVTPSHATDIDIDKELDKDIINKNIVQSDDSTKLFSKKDIDNFFESLWKLFPNKKGKGQISDSKKKELYKIGEDELSRAIDRYVKELDKDKDWRKPQNGSTFFNSGYVDYLDDNYTPGENKPKQQSKSNNKFNDFPQRDNSSVIVNLEEQLLRRQQ